MLILYGNIFKVTRNRMPADVRFRPGSILDRVPGPLLKKDVRVTVSTPLRAQSIEPTVETNVGARLSRTNSEDASSASADGRSDGDAAASRRASEYLEMASFEPAERSREPSRSDLRRLHAPPEPAPRRISTNSRGPSADRRRTLAAAAGDGASTAEERRRAGVSAGDRAVVACGGAATAERRSIPAAAAAGDGVTTANRRQAVHDSRAAAGDGAARRENKAAKTLAIVVGGFVCCWLPFFVLYVVEPFCGACHVSEALRSALTWLGYANSLVNPFIYATYNRHFRHSFWLLTVGSLKCGLLKVAGQDQGCGTSS